MIIPKGWRECQEVPATNAQTAPPSMYVDGNGCESSLKTQWAVIKTVSGESKEGLGTPDANRIEIDGIRFASDGERVITRTIPSYFSHWVPKPHVRGHDICFYCGTSNGLNGELRQVHDCCYCGSN